MKIQPIQKLRWLVVGLVLLALAAAMILMLQDRPPAISAATPSPTASPSPSPTPTPTPTPVPTPEPTPVPTPEPRLAAPMAAYPEVVGWITIDGTVIDYPVVQGTDNDYYLHNDMDGQSSVYGTIFMDYRGDANTLTGNISLYGHNMRDGSMFAGLMAYKDKTFFETHRRIIYQTPQGTTVWEIFSAYVTDTNFYFIQTDFSDESEYMAFLNTIQSKSAFTTDAVLTAADDILTFCTCTYEFDNARFAVHARRIE